MNACPARSSDCSTCPGRLVCHCLRVTEEVVLETVAALSLRTVKEVRQHTGAGDGCTACHRKIRRLLEQQAQSSSPSSSPVPI